MIHRKPFYKAGPIANVFRDENYVVQVPVKPVAAATSNLEIDFVFGTFPVEESMGTLVKNARDTCPKDPSVFAGHFFYGGR